MEDSSPLPHRPSVLERKDLEVQCKRTLQSLEDLRAKLPRLRRDRRNARIRSGLWAGVPSVLVFGLLQIVYGALIAIPVTLGSGFAVWKIGSTTSDASFHLATFEAKLSAAEQLMEKSLAQLWSVEERTSRTS
jgi:hypothetical protein